MSNFALAEHEQLLQISMSETASNKSHLQFKTKQEYQENVHVT